MILLIVFQVLFQVEKTKKLPRKHTELHGKKLIRVLFFRVFPCASVAIKRLLYSAGLIVDVLLSI